MSRNSLLWTASKIALFLLLALAVRPLEAVNYHIGTTGTNTETDVYYADLETFRIGTLTPITTNTSCGFVNLRDGDQLILYQDDASLTDQIYIGYNSTVTMKSNDSDQRRTVNPLAGEQTRLFYMDGTGNTALSKIYFEGITEISGFDDRGNTEGIGGGGVIYAWWNQYIYTQDGKSLTFKDNYSSGYMGGGVVYYWDAIECDFTDSNFIDNQTEGRGGALYINASGTLVMTNHTDITIGASDGNVSTFSGNKHLVGTALEEYNSIDFTGSTGKTANLFIKTEGTGILDMQDPFRTNAGSYVTNIIKTGTGTWKLGGDSVTANSGGTAISIQEGTLEFYENASLRAMGANDSFTVMKDATIRINGGNRIEGTTVKFSTDSILLFDMDYFFVSGNPVTDAMLFLQGTNLTVSGTTIDVLSLPENAKGSFTLIEGAEDLVAGDFNLLRDGVKIQGAASKRLGFTLNNSDDPKKLVLYVGDTENSVLVWNNDHGNGIWSLNYKNWDDQYVTHGTDAFIPNDTVIFDNSVGGGNSHTVTLEGRVAVSKDNNFHTGERGMHVSGTKDWVFKGGAITDSYSETNMAASGRKYLAALVFDGSGTLTLNNDEANTYHDGTLVSGGGTIVARGVNSLGSTEYIGKATDVAGVVVQNSGYGIEFTNRGGTIRLQSGTTYESGLPVAGIWDQRIRVADHSSGTISINNRANEPLIIMVNEEYQNYAQDKNGGAINVGNGGTLELSGNFLFTGNNSRGNGGAIFAGSNASIKIDNVAFAGNEAMNGGGAVYLGDGATVSAVSNTFRNNKAELGGAIYHAGNSTATPRTLTVSKSSFGSLTAVADDPTGNSADSGGAIYIAGGNNMTLTVTDSAFYGNDAALDGGGAVFGGDHLAMNVSNTIFQANEAATAGGAIQLGDATNFTATNTRFLSNKATDGGALSVGANADVTVDTVTFTSNEALGLGGAVSLGDATAFQATSATFQNNKAALGGAVYHAGNTAPLSVTLTFVNSFFGQVPADVDEELTTGNTAEAGGAIYIADGSNITLDMARSGFYGNKATVGSGGAIYAGGNSSTMANRFSLALNEIAFQGNTATVDGGAIYATDFSAISANDVTFLRNKALTGDGGAIRSGNRSQLIDWNGVIFQSNEAEDGSGGALYLGSNSVLEFRDSAAAASEFAENKAANSGGAIYFGSYGSIDAAYVGFKNNEAITESGGAIAMERGGILNLGLGVSFQGNKAGERGGAIDLGIESTLNMNESSTFSGNTAGESGGAVSMQDHAKLSIAQKSTFTNNTATEFHGGAVFLGENSLFDARNGVTFTGNKAGGDGGAIYLGDVTSSINTGIIAWGATFTQNTAGGNGGAIRISGGSGNTDMLTVDLHDSSVTTRTVFDRNTAGVSGGAVYGEDFVLLDADNTEFKNNTAVAFGGAVRLGSNATINIVSATFTSNRVTGVTGEGGAIYAENSATIQGNGANFTANGATRSGNTPQAVGLHGGAIRVGENSALYLNGATFKQNMVGAMNGKAGAATGMGGAIYAGADTIVDVKRSVFESNNASHSGGAVYLAASLSTTSRLFDADGAVFRANIAQNGDGGALWLGAGNDLSLATDNDTAAQFTSNRSGGAGGAIYYNGGRTVTATGAVFSSNSAGGTGGAIHIQNATDLNIIGANFASNNAMGAGGAIYATAPGTILANQTRFVGNNGTQGGAIYLGQTGSTTTFQGLGSEFSSNLAKNGSGGALYAINTNLSLYGSTFRNNTATGKGGAIYYETTGGTRSLTFGADAGQITGFSGNTANGTSSSIHFAGTGTSTTAINMTVNTALDGTFELLDSMRVDGTDNNVRLNIAKTGLGTMVLGNVHDFRSAADATAFTVDAGSFDMQKGSKLMLTHKDGDDLFMMASGTRLISRGENIIAAGEITLTDELHFDLNNIVPNSKAVALTLDGTVLGTIGGAGDVVNIVDFVDQSGFYNLVRTSDVNNFADKDDLAATTLQYKGVDFRNNDRLLDYWELHVNEDTETGVATLQLELRQWGKAEMTWNGNDGNFWNVEQRNWNGTSEGKPVDQFMDGDSVVFGDQGAGIVNVSPNDVVVDSMVVNSSKDYEFQGGTITGNTFVKDGSGTLTMSSAYDFNTIDIVNGTLLGGVGSDWTVIGNLNLKAGTVFRPTDKFRIDGNLAMSGGSSALWELGAVQAHSTAITATGKVDFGTGGGDVYVRIENIGLSSGQYASDNPIVTAVGGLTLNGESIEAGIYGVSNRVVQIVDGEQALVLQSDRSLALQAAVVSKDSTELSLIAFGTGFGAEGPTTNDFNQNQMAVYEALENADYQTLANEFFVELAKLGSVEEKAEALDNMHTRVNSAAVLVAERNILKINTTIYDRARLLEEMRSEARSYQRLLGQSSYGGRANYSPWFTNLGDFMDQDGSGGTRGFKSKMYGFMLGVDRNLSRDTVFGVGLGGTFSTVESGITQSAKVDSYMVSVYGAYNADDDWTLTGNIGAASTEYEFKRRVFSIATETSLRGSSVFGGVEISKRFRNEYADVRPYASLQFVSMNVKSFTDRSLGVAGDVKVKSSDSEAFLQTLGVRFGRARSGLWDAVWMPSLNMGWIHDYGKGNIRSTTSFGNASSFTTVGAKRVRDRIVMGVGSHVAYQHVTFHGSYDSEFSGRYVSHTVQAGLNFVF